MLFRSAAAGSATPVKVRINGRPVTISAAPSSYAELKRAWKSGDVVDLDLPMPAQLIEANPLVEETYNQVAVKRGPIVYCLESPELPRGTRLSEVLVPHNIDLRARYDRRLLDGVVVLEGQGFTRAQGNWTNQLYREVHSSRLRPIELRFIPYYAWNNRGASEMSVWLPALLSPR